MITNDRLKQKAAATAEATMNKARPAAEKAAATAQSLQNQLQDQAQNLMKETTRLVAKYPEWSLLAAVSTGVMIGYLLKRR